MGTMLHSEVALAEPVTIRVGDLVIVYERYDCMKSVTVTPKGRYDNRYGSFAMKVCPHRRRPRLRVIHAISLVQAALRRGNTKQLGAMSRLRSWLQAAAPARCSCWCCIEAEKATRRHVQLSSKPSH